MLSPFTAYTQAQSADGAALAEPKRGQRHIGGDPAKFGFLNTQRQQRDIVRGGIATGDAVFFSTRLSIIVPRGTTKPLLRSPLLMSGCSSAIAIDGVGAR